MGKKPGWKRKVEKRDPAGQRDEFVQSMKRKAGEEAAARPPKKPRDREKSWVKRWKLAVEEVAAREERRATEQVLIDEEMFGKLDGLYAEYKRRLWQRWDEEIEREAQVYEEYARMDLQRRIFPPDEIQPLAICPAVGRMLYRSLDQSDYVFATITRFSETRGAAAKRAARLENGTVFERFLTDVLGVPGDAARNRAAALQNQCNGNVVMDLSSKGTRAKLDAFSSLQSAFDNFEFARFWESKVVYGNKKVILIVRGMDGFLVDHVKLRELHRAATERGAQVQLCFYLNDIGRFSYLIHLGWLLSEPVRIPHLAYTRKWLATLTHYRQNYESSTYAQLKTRGRNFITNIGIAY